MSTVHLPLIPAARPALLATVPRKAVAVLLGSAALAISAQVQVPMWPVPVTGQTLVALLLGFVLGPRLAVATVLTYLAEGAVGMPVFAGFGAGAGHLVGPTAGYLWGFVLAAGLTGVLAERGWHRSAPAVAAAMVLGNVVIYALGFSLLATWLHTFAPETVAWGSALSGAWSNGVLPFLVGDVVKIALAVGILPELTRRTT